MTLSVRELKRLARALIAECGGLDEAAQNCRVSKSKLSDYQLVHAPLFMPVDVVASLEEYCGKPIVSSALFARFDAAALTGDLTTAACEVVEASADLQHRIRTDSVKGRLSEADRAAIEEDLQEVEAGTERARALLRGMDQSGPASGRLRCV